MPASWSLRFALPLGMMVASLAVVNCSGGSTTPAPPSTPATMSATFALPQSAATSVPLPAVNGHTVTISAQPGAPANDTATVTVSQTAPLNAPSPSAHARNPRSIANAVAFLYVTIAFSQDTPASVFGAQSVTLNGEPANANYYMEVDDLSAVVRISTVPGSNSSTQANFITNNSALAGFTFLAGRTYLFQFYYVTGPLPTPAPSATPVPSPSASASPSPAPTGTSHPNAEYTFNPTDTQTVTNNSGLSIVSNDTATGVSVTAKWTTMSPGSSSPGGSYTFSQGVAMNQNNDITPSGFPSFSQTGQLLITYLKYSANVEQATYYSPQLTITTSAFPPNTICTLWQLAGSTWSQMQIAQQTPSAGSVTFPQTVENAQIYVGNANSTHGSLYLALSCSGNKLEYTFTPTTATMFTSGGTIVTNDTSTGVSASSTWPSSSPGGSYSFSQGLALNQNGDITPPGFPALTPPSGYTVITYVKYGAKPQQTFTSTPNATFTAASIGGKTTCSLYGYAFGGTAAWQGGFVPAQAPSGNSVTFPAASLGSGQAVTVGNANSSNGSTYLALACQ